MYKIEYAWTCYLVNDELYWKDLLQDTFPTEKDAYERIGREIITDNEEGALGEFAYRVVKSGE